MPARLSSFDMGQSLTFPGVPWHGNTVTKCKSLIVRRPSGKGQSGLYIKDSADGGHPEMPSLQRVVPSDFASLEEWLEKRIR